MDAMRFLAENKIKEAMENGDFDNLLGKGKPLVFSDSQLPPEIRMMNKVLHNAGLTPVEVALQKEIRELKEELKTASDQTKKDVLMQKILDNRLNLDILMERRRKRR